MSAKHTPGDYPFTCHICRCEIADDCPITSHPTMGWSHSLAHDCVAAARKDLLEALTCAVKTLGALLTDGTVPHRAEIAAAIAKGRAAESKAEGKQS